MSAGLLLVRRGHATDAMAVGAPVLASQGERTAAPSGSALIAGEKPAEARQQRPGSACRQLGAGGPPHPEPPRSAWRRCPRARRTLDPHIAPPRVLPGQPLDQATRFGRERRTTRSGTAPSPLSLQRPVPVAKRLRAHRKAGPPLGRKQPAHRSEQGSVVATRTGGIQFLYPTGSRSRPQANPQRCRRIQPPSRTLGSRSSTSCSASAGGWPKLPPPEVHPGDERRTG